MLTTGMGVTRVAATGIADTESGVLAIGDGVISNADVLTGVLAGIGSTPSWLPVGDVGETITGTGPVVGYVGVGFTGGFIGDVGVVGVVFQLLFPEMHVLFAAGVVPAGQYTSQL